MRKNTITAKSIRTPVVGMMVLCVRNIPMFKCNTTYTICGKTVDEEDDTVYLIKVDTMEKVVYPHVLMENFMEVVNDNSAPKTDDIGEELSSLISEAKKKHEEKYADVEKANRRIKAVEELLYSLGSTVHVRLNIEGGSFNGGTSLTYTGTDKKFYVHNSGFSTEISSSTARCRLSVSKYLEDFVKEVIKSIQ